MSTEHVVYMGGAKGYYVGTKPPQPDRADRGLPAVDGERFATSDEAQRWADALNQRRPDAR